MPVAISDWTLLGAAASLPPPELLRYVAAARRRQRSRSRRLFGAAQHLLAKTMSLIVGIALAAAAIIALASGNVLGLAAANRWTELAWGVVAAILLFNTVIPRRRRRSRPPAIAMSIPVQPLAPKIPKKTLPCTGALPFGKFANFGKTCCLQEVEARSEQDSSQDQGWPASQTDAFLSPRSVVSGMGWPPQGLVRVEWRASRDPVAVALDVRSYGEGLLALLLRRLGHVCPKAGPTSGCEPRPD